MTIERLRLLCWQCQIPMENRGTSPLWIGPSSIHGPCSLHDDVTSSLHGEHMASRFPIACSLAVRDAFQQPKNGKLTMSWMETETGIQPPGWCLAIHGFSHVCFCVYFGFFVCHHLWLGLNIGYVIVGLPEHVVWFVGWFCATANICLENITMNELQLPVRNFGSFPGTTRWVTHYSWREPTRGFFKTLLSRFCWG